MGKTKFVVLVVVMLWLANCTVPLPVVTTTPTPSLPVVTVTPTPQATDTLTPDIKPSVTATSTARPTNTPTFTPTLTWTPLPTLSEQQARAKIRELLETNGGCELPCWWGIIPNETKWTDASHYLSPFIVNLVQQDTQVLIEGGKRQTYTNVQFYYVVPNETILGRMTLGAIDNIVVGMTVYPPGAEYQYQLHQLLALLGPPKQILISAQASSPIPELPPTVLVLDYSDIGVWASYGYIPAQVGENLEICPKSSLGKVSRYDNVGGRLELFDPKLSDPSAVSIQEYADMVGGLSAKKLEDVTNMNVETFYNTFIEPNYRTCLETPANLWP